MKIVVVLDNIRSLHNVGSIFRTADGAGVDKIYLCGITPAPVDKLGKPRPQFVKVSLGAENSVKWEKRRTTIEVIRELKNPPAGSDGTVGAGGGYKIFAVEQDKRAIPYYKIRGIRMDSKIRIALIMGAEVKGLPESILKKADKILEIPMKEAMVRQVHHPRRTRLGKESLNVSMAFAIIAYHLKFGAK